MPKTIEVAEIIAFPRHLIHTRLQHALIALQHSIEDERRAIARWRTAIGELRIVTTRIGESLSGLDDNLARTQGSITSLTSQTRDTERWAARHARSG